METPRKSILRRMDSAETVSGRKVTFTPSPTYHTPSPSGGLDGILEREVARRGLDGALKWLQEIAAKKAAPSERGPLRRSGATTFVSVKDEDTMSEESELQADFLSFVNSGYADDPEASSDAVHSPVFTEAQRERINAEFACKAAAKQAKKEAAAMAVKAEVAAPEDVLEASRRVTTFHELPADERRALKAAPKSPVRPTAKMTPRPSSAAPLVIKRTVVPPGCDKVIRQPKIDFFDPSRWQKPLKVPGKVDGNAKDAASVGDAPAVDGIVWEKLTPALRKAVLAALPDQCGQASEDTPQQKEVEVEEDWEWFDDWGWFLVPKSTPKPKPAVQPSPEAVCGEGEVHYEWYPGWGWAEVHEPPKVADGEAAPEAEKKKKKSCSGDATEQEAGCKDKKKKKTAEVQDGDELEKVKRQRKGGEGCDKEDGATSEKKKMKKKKAVETSEAPGDVQEGCELQKESVEDGDGHGKESEVGEVKQKKKKKKCEAVAQEQPVDQGHEEAPDNKKQKKSEGAETGDATPVSQPEQVHPCKKDAPEDTAASAAQVGLSFFSVPFSRFIPYIHQLFLASCRLTLRRRLMRVSLRVGLRRPLRSCGRRRMRSARTCAPVETVIACL